MSSLPVTPAAMLAKYLQAEIDVLAGKTITFQGRSMSMENLEQIRAGRKEWEQKVSLQTGRAVCRPTIGGMPFSVASFNQE